MGSLICRRTNGEWEKRGTLTNYSCIVFFLCICAKENCFRKTVGPWREFKTRLFKTESICFKNKDFISLNHLQFFITSRIYKYVSLIM